MRISDDPATTVFKRRDVCIEIDRVIWEEIPKAARTDVQDGLRIGT
jgi:hypothetical protein